MEGWVRDCGVHGGCGEGGVGQEERPDGIHALDLKIRFPYNAHNDPRFNIQIESPTLCGRSKAFMLSHNALKQQDKDSLKKDKLL